MIYLGCDPGSTMTAPKYARVAEDIRAQIRSGTLKVGDRLPSTTALIARYQVSYGTVRAAILVLKAERIVEGQQGAAGPARTTSGCAGLRRYIAGGARTRRSPVPRTTLACRTRCGSPPAFPGRRTCPTARSRRRWTTS